MPPTLSPQQRLRIAMVAREAWSVRRLAESLTKIEHSGLIAPPLVPRMAFFVVEANDTLAGLVPGYVPAAAMNNNGIVARSLRAHMKLAEENDGRPGLLAVLRDCEVKSTEWFQRPHRGVLGPLKRWLQADMGMYFVNEDLVSTTHLVLAALSLGDLDALDAHENPLSLIGPRSRDFAAKVGEFVGEITRAAPELEEAPKTPPSFVTYYSDCKAAELYPDLAKAAGIGWENAPGLSAAIAKANVAHVVLPALLPAESDFLLRQRVLTASYAAGHVSMLYRDAAAGSFVRHLSTTLSGRGGRDLRRVVTPRLRGDLAHYGVEALQLPAHGPQPTSLRTALAHHRTSAAELEAIAISVLGVISDECRFLIPAKYRRRPS